MPNILTAEEDKLLTPAQVAERLGIRTETLKKYRKTNSLTKGPKCVYLNDRVVRYKLSDVLDWVNSKVTNGA